jgi:hypothetical protein
LLAFAREKDVGTFFAGLLGSSIHEDTNLNAAFSYQISGYMNVWELFRQQASFRSRLALPFVHDFWARAVNRTGFNFRSPREVSAQLELTSSVAPIYRIHHVIRTVADGLGARLPEKAKSWLKAGQSPE